MMSVKIKVQQGSVYVNDIYVHVDNEDCLVLEVDCGTNHFEAGPISLGVVTLWKPKLVDGQAVGDLTYINIDIEGIFEGWLNSVECSGSIAMIFYWKPNPNGILLWTVDNEGKPGED